MATRAHSRYESIAVQSKSHKVNMIVGFSSNPEVTCAEKSLLSR